MAEKPTRTCSAAVRVSFRAQCTSKHSAWRDEQTVTKCEAVAFDAFFFVLTGKGASNATSPIFEPRQCLRG